MPDFDDYIYMYRDLADPDVFSDQSAYGVITNFMASKISTLLIRVDDKLGRLIVGDLSDHDIEAIFIYNFFLAIHYKIGCIFQNIIQITPMCVRRFAPYILPCLFITSAMVVFSEVFLSSKKEPPCRALRYANQEEQEEQKIELLKRAKTSIFMFKYSETPDLKGFKGIGKSYIRETWLPPIGKAYIRETTSTSSVPKYKPFWPNFTN